MVKQFFKFNFMIYLGVSRIILSFLWFNVEIGDEKNSESDTGVLSTCDTSLSAFSLTLHYCPCKIDQLIIKEEFLFCSV